jgi:hypothetical protein
MLRKLVDRTVESNWLRVSPDGLYTYADARYCSGVRRGCAWADMILVSALVYFGFVLLDVRSRSIGCGLGFDL